MNTMHLAYAVEVERCGSITQAAENLYMAQPNLSKAIKELEESMGFSIFARTSRGVVPTARGREFLGYARAILAQVRKMESLSQAPSNGAQRFSLILPHGGCAALCLERFLETIDPEAPLDVRVQEAGTAAALSEVADGRCQLGVACYDAAREKEFEAQLREKSLSALSLAEYDCVALLSLRHPLAAARQIALADLAACPEILPEDPPFGRHRQENPRRIAASCWRQQWELLGRLPSAYAWSAPEPPALLARYGLTQRPCPERELRLRDALIFPAGYHFSPLEERFRDMLAEACGQMAGR